MSISDVLAIRNLMPGQEPEVKFLRLEDGSERRHYKFSDKADELAALAEADQVLEQLREKHDDDQEAVGEELHEIVEADDRLRAAVLHAVFNELYEDPRIQKACCQTEAGRARQNKAGRKAGINVLSTVSVR